MKKVYYTDKDGIIGEKGKKYYSQKDLLDVLEVKRDEILKHIEEYRRAERTIEIIVKRDKLANDMGISVELAYEFIKIFNYDDELIDEFIKQFVSAVEFRGNEYESTYDLLNEYGISISTFFRSALNFKDNENIIVVTVENILNRRSEKERKRIRLELNKRIMEIYQEKRGSTTIPSKKLKELIEQSITTGEELDELINQYEENQYKEVYEYKGKKIKGKENLARELGITVAKLKSYLKQYGDNVEAIVEDIERKYFYDDKSFSTIQELSEYLEIDESTLGFYMKRVNLESAVFIAKIKRINNTKGVKLEIPGIEGDTEITIRDLAILLGIKYKDLVFCISRGMSISDIRARTPENQERIAYEEKIEILKQCIRNDEQFNYTCTLVETYGGQIENSINRTYQKSIPLKLVEVKYGALINLLMEQYNIESENIIRLLRKGELYIDEIIEDEFLKNQNAEYRVMNPLYSIISSNYISEEERETMIQKMEITPEKIACIECVQEKKQQIDRLLLLNRIAQILKDEQYSEEEKQKLLKENNITPTEIETIYLDLYDQYSFKKGARRDDENNLKKKRVRDIAKNWINMTAEERAEINDSSTLTQKDKSYIIKISNLIEHYKRMIIELNRDSQGQGDSEQDPDD